MINDCVSGFQCKELKIYMKGNSAKIYSMSKFFEKLFTPTLNKIAVSFWYVSSTSVVLHVGLKDRWRRIQINKMKKDEEN